MKKLMKNILLIVLVILIDGCNRQNNSITISKPIINENLPTIDASRIKSIPDMNSIALEWKPIAKPEVKGYYIYRANMTKGGDQLTRIATINSKYASHYLDTNLKPDKQYMYAISTIGTRSTESRPSQSVSVNTKSKFKSVNFIIAISNLPRQIKILWRPHLNPRVSRYIIERSDEKNTQWKKIKTVKHRYSVEYMDRNIGDNAKYSYRIKALTFDNIVSSASEIVSATTKPLPKGVFTLKATKNLPNRIRLTWDPLDSKDIQYYNIYRANSSKGSYEVIGKARPLDDTFDDNINKHGIKKFYKITVVDKDDLESTMPNEITMGRSLPIPKKPIIISAQINDNKIILQWKASDKRSKTYNIHKTIVESFFKRKTEVIPNISDTKYIDKDIKRGITYEYRIEAIDSNGLVSKKTVSTSLSIPKLQNKKENASSSNN